MDVHRHFYVISWKLSSSARNRPRARIVFSFVIFIVFLAMAGGLGYGLFQKHQKANSDKKLQASLEENDKLMQAKFQVELELADVNEEMKDIREMAEKIQQALGILGQGGGDSSVSWVSEGTEESADTQQGKCLSDR